MAAPEQTVTPLAISSAKQLLLEKWKKGEHQKPPTIPNRPGSAPSPLSFAQQRLWFLDQLVPENTAYNITFALRLSGDVDLVALRSSFNEVIRRHEALRTAFRSCNGNAHQVVEEPFELDIAQVDLRHIAASERQATIERIANEETVKPFNLTQLPLLRVTLLRLGERDHVMLGIVHHIIFDGWSVSVFQSEFFECYRSFTIGRQPRLPRLPIQYPDFAEWQRHWLQGERLQRQLDYWKLHMRGELPVLQLPTDKARPLVPSFKGASSSFSFDEELVQPLRRLCDETGVTSFMLILAGLNVWLHGYSGQEDILIGCPIANRNYRELEGLIGNFANTLVLRTCLGGDPSFRELLTRVRKRTLEAYENQDLPFEKLVNELHLDRDMSRNPLFQVMLNFETRRISDVVALPSLKVVPLVLPQAISKFDLWFTIAELPVSFCGELEYSTDLFSDATATRMLGHLKHALQQLVQAPDQPISRVTLVTPAEVKEVVFTWNDTAVSYELGQGLHQLFEIQAHKSRNAPACIFENSALTYEALNQRANRVARCLRGHGVGPDSLVGIACNRSLEMVIGLLGVLKAGGAYLPLDPEYPADRLKFMVENSGVAIILVQSSLARRFAGAELRLISLEEVGNNRDLDADNFAGLINPGQLAYAIYTSGSTGNPKAGLNAHLGICNRLLWMQETYRLTASDRVLQKTSFSFDVSVWEIFWPLITGSCIVLARPGGHKDPEYLAQLIQAQKVTTLHFVPSMLRLFLEVPGIENCSSLRRVICSGEALPQELAERFASRFPGVPLYNLYGPTEAAIDVTACHYVGATGQSTVPIGRPIANLQTYVLDQHMTPVPAGVPGELHIGGIGVGRGYLNHPDLTAEKFIPDSLGGKPGGRLYRTGDLTRWLPTGDLEFLDRIDSQVKVKGYRIELGEVEAHLRDHPSVKDAAVVTREDDRGDKQLIAYVVPATPSKAEGEALSAELVQQWRGVFDETYNGAPTIAEVDDRLDFAGWVSSYTGEPIERPAMEEWLQQTVDRILRLEPASVLELGCGTGLLLLSIAPKCKRYVGTDISKRGLRHIAGVIEGKAEYAGVELRSQAADTAVAEETERFDLVVLNSVVQYFPTVDYLMRVLECAVKVVRDGGHIFLGDVRHHGLLKAFHSSLEVDRSVASMPAEAVRQRVLTQMQQESELVIDPEFFYALPEKISGVSSADVWLRRSRHGDEMTKFRFDAILKVRGEPPASPVVVWNEWREAEMNLDGLRQQLAAKQPQIIALTGIVNSRVEKEVQMAGLLADCAERFVSVDELRCAAVNLPQEGIDPETLWRLGEDLEYEVRAGWRRHDKPEQFSVIVQRRGQRDDSGIPDGVFHDATQHAPMATHVNDPLKNKVAQSLVVQLRRHLREKLPDFMTPAHFVMLETLPLTTSGKLDRKALPSPTSIPPRQSELVLPCTPLQELLAGIWRENLGVEEISIQDNFFELGGDSIQSIRVVAAMQKAGLKVTVQQMFKHQTILELCAAMEHSTDAYALERPLGDDGSIRVIQELAEPGPATDFPLVQLDQPVVDRYLPGADIEDYYPLGSLPEDMLVQHLAIGDPSLNMVWGAELERGIDPVLFAEAYQTLAERYAVLRTSFLWEGVKMPLQVVHRKATIPVEREDWRGLSGAELRAKTRSFLRQNAERGVDLRQPPSARLFMGQVGKDAFVVCRTFNYMCLEGWSGNLVTDQHVALYAALQRNEALKEKSAVSYRDYISWLSKLDWRQARQFWQEELDGALLPTPLVDRIPGNMPTSGNIFERETSALSGVVTEKIRSLVRSHRMTESVFYQAVWALLVSRYSGQRDVVFGLAMNGRSVDFADITQMVGCTLNFLPVRVKIDEEEDFLACVSRMQQKQWQLIQYEHLPPQGLKSWLGVSPNKLLFQSVLYYQNLKAPVMQQTMGWFYAKTVVPLRIDVYPRTTRLGTELHMSYHVRDFDQATILRIMSEYKTMLATLATNPARKIKELIAATR